MKDKYSLISGVAFGFALIGFIGNRFIGGDTNWLVFCWIAIGMCAYLFYRRIKEEREKK